MPVMDEFKNEREALKNGTFKQKFSYFWYYYKWHVIVTVAIVAFLISFIHEVVTKKDDAFYGVFVNSYPMETSEEYMQGFADYLGVDAEKYNVWVDSSMYISNTSMDETTITSTQKLMVYTAAGDIDVMLADAPTFEQYANNSTFMDLREALTPEQLEKYEPYFYYIDQAAVDEKDAAQEELNDAYVPEYPDPSKPEEMQQPIPVALFVDSSESLFGAYQFKEKPVVMGIVVNTKRPGEAVKFIDYIFSE